MLLPIEPTFTPTFWRISAASGSMKLRNQGCLQHMGKAQIITDVEDPHHGECFGHVVREAVHWVCRNTNLENTKLHIQGFPEGIYHSFAMGKNFPRCWQLRLDLHSFVMDVEPEQLDPIHLQLPTFNSIGHWCALSFLFNQQWFLNRHRRFQFRTDGTSFSASDWAGVGQQVQEDHSFK